MGRIPRAHVRPLNWNGRTSWSASCGNGIDLDADDCQVNNQGGWKGIKGGLCDRSTVQGGGGRNIGGNSRDASLVGPAHPRVGLEFPPN